nr:reverse transcriptase domain-containing protein [Tanacetum cinerariifolium]
MQQKKYVKDPIEIHNIKQRDGETIKDFMEHFKIETGRMKGAPECMRISGFMHGVNNPELTKRLNEHVPKTMEEIMITTTAFIRGEAAATSKKKGHASWKPQDQSKRHSSDKRPDFRGHPRGERGSNRFTTLTKTPKEILATEATSNGMEGPLVIEAKISGHVIHCMYIDGGSLMEILYEHCYNRLRPEIKSQMVPATTSLTGFSGETIWPLGQLRLLVTIGDATNSTKAWMNFMVVKSMSPYNGIIGRLGLKAIQAVPSTFYGMLKFPVEGGIATTRGTILIPTECASMTTSSFTPGEERTRPANFTVALHPDFLDQKVVIEGSLSDKGRTELCSVLKKNLDIFTWKPSDMIGVPRSITEHRLNVWEGYTPVRQKKKSQASERARAIQAEVQKLVDARIMREVYCHDWLSNPIMVKKHDGSWRMCVDFTDLNRACPQDCYPLPEIDWKVESLCGYPFKCFLDAYKGFHQIQLAEADEEKTAFHTGQGVYCYTKMPFGLKNAGATYQRLMDKAFEIQVGRNIELKQHLSELPLLVAPNPQEELIMYLSATYGAVSVVLMTERGTTQMLIYFISRALQGPELNYSPMEKLVLSLVFASKRLRRPRTSVKGQILADFLIEMPCDIPQAVPTAAAQEEPWTLFTDGSSCVAASNNEAEYEALVAGLRIATQMGVKNIQVNVDSKLVANQVLGTYVAKEDNMIKYLEIVRGLVSGFTTFSISQVLQSKNKQADAVSKIASTSFAHLSKHVLVEVLENKSIKEKEVAAVIEEDGTTWMTQIADYLKEGILPGDNKEARKLRLKARQYELMKEVLYRRSFLTPWLRCVGPLQADYVMREIHKGSCSMHAGPRSVVAKAIWLGYYWSTMHKDARDMIRKWNDCQIHRPVTRHPQQSLTPIMAPWPFYKWRIDIAGPFPEGPGKVKFLIVVMDYFTKWVKAKAVATITGGQVKKFVWDNIVCRLGILGKIISDNDKQFADNPFKDWCDKLNITQRFASVKHPQSNGLVERANRSLGEGIKARLGEGNKNWVEELPHVLWAHRTMIKSSHDDTPFSLTYGTEAERREGAAVCEARAKSKMMKYYNVRVRGVAFKPGDFVYRSNDASHTVAGGKLGPKWEGPYEVTEALGNGAYKLQSTDGTVLPRTWNVTNLKRYYL